MNHKIKILSITIFSLMFLVRCIKDDSNSTDLYPDVYIGNTNDIDSTDSYSGVYIGNTYEINKWANSLTNYETQEKDTLFIDTFLVSIISDDTIIFSNKGVEWKFKFESDTTYTIWYGSHSLRNFEFVNNDSLKVHYWSYGGYGSSYNQTNIDFAGIKQ